MEISSIISVITILIILIFWPCFIIIVSLKNKKAKFALMKGKVRFRIRIVTSNWDYKKEKKVYIATNNKKFNSFKEAYIYQKKISSRNYKG